MNYADLKKGILDIAAVADAVPEKFKDRCFELLLSHMLGELVGREQKPPVPGTKPAKNVPPADSLPSRTSLRVLMRKTGLTEEELQQVIMFADGEAHFLKEPNTRQVTLGQFQWALMLALKNAVLNDALTTDPEALRSICQEKGYYDQANFSANFKRGKFIGAFAKQLSPQGEPQKLSPSGMDALADTVRSVLSK